MFWQNKKYSASDAAQRGYPVGEDGVKFVSIEGSVDGQHIYVRVQDKAGKQFRMALSRFSQPMMMRAALLRKLGYQVLSPQYYNRLKVNFADEEEKKQIILELQAQFTASFELRGWTIEETANSVVFTSATLEIPTTETFDLHWGLGPPANSGALQLMSRNRAYRALIMPYSIVDVPESINRYSTKFVSLMKGYAIINYWLAPLFEATDFEDSRWILRKMAALSQNDWMEIVANSGYPLEVQPLVLAKLVNRLNNALEIFQVPQQLLSIDISQINSSSGFIKEGKVTKPFYPGYPQKFSHPVSEDPKDFDVRKSPFEDGDIVRFLGTVLNSSLVESALGRLNKKLEVMTAADAAAKYQKEVYNKIIDHITKHPNEPMHKEVTSWGGPLLGANINASRHVATGTYAGSTAPVQLVDNLTVGVGLGVFRALDGLDTWLPLMGANVSVIRDYTHVRPILSMKEGSKEDWGRLLVPAYMAQLAKNLKGGPVKDSAGIEQDSLDAFISSLRDGEVFTITDSIGLGAHISTSASIDVLLGLTPFNFLNSVTLGADASRVILSQTTIVRIGKGIQVIVKKAKNRGQGLELTANFFLELLKIRSETQVSDIRSHAFVIDYNPNWKTEGVEDEAKMEELRDNLKLSLIPILRSNNTELLYDAFPDRMFKIQHDLKTNETKAKFLAWKFATFNEDHTLKIQYPIDLDHPELDPKDEEVVLFANKRGELVGRDLLGLLFDIIDGILTETKVTGVNISKSIGDNPADVPFGRAHWKIVNTEADLSTFKTPYDSVSMIDYTWGGWSLKKEKFLKVIDDIEKKFSFLTTTGVKLIDRQEFNNVESLDFYRINAHVTFTASGVNMIRDLILQPQVSGKRKDKDWAFFNQFIKLKGGGDIKKGQEEYFDKCSREQNVASHIPNPPADYRGNDYGCMGKRLYEILRRAEKYPADRKGQAQWTNYMISMLEKEIPISALLQYLGEKNFIAFVNINGFRPGDEDGDLEYFSNVMGDPETNDPQANGLISMFIRKTRLLPTELERTQGSFQ